MKLNASYQNFSHSPWMDELLEANLHKIDHLIPQDSTIRVHCRYDSRAYVTTLSIHNYHQDFTFNAMAEDLVDSITEAVIKARRKLVEKKQKVKNHIHKYAPILKKQLA